VIALASSIKSAVDDATRRLAQSGRTDTPRLDAEVLMGFVLGWPRARLFGHWDEPVDDDRRARFDAFVERRAAGEPVAYIRNLKEFMGFEFYVDPRVLIPRPETELLVARAVGWLLGRAAGTSFAGDPPRVADIGTGSGAVAIGILRSFPSAQLLAMDTSSDALEVARINAQRHGVSLDLRQGSLLEPVPDQVDLVVANLPYLSRDEYESLLDTSIAFEPRGALTDEADGLRLFDQLLAQVPAKLAPGGAVLLEIGAGQPRPLRDLARRRLPGFTATVFADYAGLPRVLQLQA
jgi:release factor glutamine methyltransferase